MEPRKSWKYKDNTEFKQTVHTMYRAGLSIHKIGQILGCNDTTVLNIVTPEAAKKRSKKGLQRKIERMGVKAYRKREAERSLKYRNQRKKELLELDRKEISSRMEEAKQKLGITKKL